MATHYLMKKSFKILERNVRTRQGEADLVCLDGETLVIVEVKSGQADPDHPPRVHVGPDKQRKLLALAEEQQKQRKMMGCSVRIDVVEVLWKRGEKGYTVQYYPAAVTRHSRRL